MVRAYVFALMGAVAACDGGGDDGGDDVPPGDAPPDVDNGTCGAELRFTGEHVDWNSGANFCGIFGATFTVRGTSAADSTAPNGRFDTCVPDQEVTQVDVAPPTTMSACNGTGELYRLPAIAVVRKDVLLAGGAWSSRAFTPSQLPRVSSPGNGHIFVHVVGGPRKVSLGLSPVARDPARAFVNNQWTPVAVGEDPVGNDVIFPYVVTSGDLKVTVKLEGGTPVEIPMLDNVLTMITLVAN